MISDVFDVTFEYFDEDLAGISSQGLILAERLPVRNEHCWMQTNFSR